MNTIDEKYYNVVLSFNNYYQCQFTYTGELGDHEIIAYYTTKGDDEVILRAEYTVVQLISSVRWVVFLVPPL